MNWQDFWKEAAIKERKHQDATPVADLLRALRKGWYGQYYTIWYSVAERATLAEAGWTLYRVLANPNGRFDRTHCARALLHLLKDSSFSAEELGGYCPLREQKLEALRAALEQAIGPEPPEPPR